MTSGQPKSDTRIPSESVTSIVKEHAVGAHLGRPIASDNAEGFNQGAKATEFSRYRRADGHSG